MSELGAIYFIFVGAVFFSVGVLLAGDVRGLTSKFQGVFARSQAMARNQGAGLWSVGAMRVFGAFCVLAGLGVILIGAFHV
jgi:hypothetical protein